MNRRLIRGRSLPTRLVATVAAVGVLFSPALLAGPSQAGSDDPKFRKVTPPHVFYPVTGTKQVVDQKTYGKRRKVTDIKAPCGSLVYAAHPGRAQVLTGTSWSGTNLVRVISGTNGVVTTYAYMSRPLLVDGQVVQSGQPLGQVGKHPKKKTCQLGFGVTQGGAVWNPTTWLARYVGQTPPVPTLFDSPGITVASFNILGASHTRSNSRYATYPSRTDRAFALLDERKVDVAGLQEFQEIQNDYIMPKVGETWGIHHWDPDGPEGKRRDTENAIVWRKSTMEFVSGETFDIPYFNGNIRHVPAVLLKEIATGRTAYFLNVHNASNVRGNAAHYRAQAIAIEKQKMIDLRATGRPVFLMGDFNDREKAFCPLTENKLSISPNSIPSTTCAYPKQTSIDWIFAAGQTRFSYFLRDKFPQTAKISDHPLVITEAHLQD